MKNNFKRVKSFDKWMRNIKNIYYSENESMLNAYQKIEAHGPNTVL